MSPKNRQAYNTTLLVSIALMVIGGAVAWGLGGLMFGLGLWLTLALMVEDFKEHLQ